MSACGRGGLVSTRPSRDALAVAPQPAPGTAPWNWRLHQSIYRHHPRIGAAIVAAPVHAAAFAVTGTRLDARTIPESYLLLRQVATVAFKDWIDPQKLAAQVSLNQPALLLQNGGALVVGRTMLEAFDRLEVLESTASALIGALPLGGCRPMGARQVAELQAVFGTETKKEEESQRHEDAKTRRREK